MIKKLLLIKIILLSSLFSREYITQIKPFEKYEIKAQNQGLISFINKNLESSFVKEKQLLLQIDFSDENIDLEKLKQNLFLQKEIIEIKERNYKSKARIKQLSTYDKNSEKLSLLEAKKELNNTIQQIKKLENVQRKKTFNIKNRYIDTIYVNKGEYVNIGDKLYNAYDFSKQKVTLYLSQEEISNLKNQKIYIDKKESNFKVYKIHKIKDEKRVSRFKVEFIKENINYKNFFFDKIIKIELK